MQKPQIPREVVVAALRTACHSFENAGGRWADRIKSGMTDDQVLAALAQEFGIWGGSGVYGLGDDGPRCEWWQDHRGGTNPTIAVYRFAKMGMDKARLTIKGQGLVNLTREVFKIPFPDGRLQLDLLYALVALALLTIYDKRTSQKGQRMKTACYFTYFGPGRVGISRFNPRGVSGYRVYRTLAPWRGMLDLSEAKYRDIYFNEILACLDPQKVVADVDALAGEHEPVLLCFERPPFTPTNWCHRRMVAEWLADKIGIDVSELERGGGAAPPTPGGNPTLI